MIDCLASKVRKAEVGTVRRASWFVWPDFTLIESWGKSEGLLMFQLLFLLLMVCLGFKATCSIGM